MVRRNRIKNKLIFSVICTLLVLMASFGLISILTAKNSFSNDTEVRWDGVTIASSFSLGNGTIENPYLISNGEELAYFKQVIESNSIYSDKYYALSNNINLDNHEWIAIGNRDNIFKGHFDGRGYTIKNIKNINGQVINGYDYYGLFSITDGASIINLNIDNLIVNPSSSNNLYKIGTVVSEIRDFSKISNISIYNSSIDLDNTLENKDNMIGGFSAYIGSNVTFNNIYVGVSIKANYNTSFGRISNTLLSDANYIISDVDINLTLKNNISDYVNSDGVIYNTFVRTDDGYSDGKNVISRDNLIIELNKDLDLNYTWVFDDYLKIAIVNNSSDDVEAIKTFAFSAKNPISLHDSGVVGDTVYVNDLDSDYNYYMGKNYTDSDGTLPTLENKNIYNSLNLVKVYIAYDGSDISDPSLVGYVSVSEQQSKYIYYKYYVVENGYVDIELIDNPFTDRPNDKGFNGWVTDYPGAIISYDYDYYVRHVKVPVTYTNGIPDDISITMNASWVKAKVYQITSNSNGVWNTAFNSLNAAGMQEIGGRTPIYEDMAQYYIFGSANFWGNYPDGAVDKSGNDVNGRCMNFGGCDYYIRNDDNAYNPDLTYYELINNRMTVHIPQIIGYDEMDGIKDGDLATGYYKKVTIPRNSSIAGYYNNIGVYQTSGTCTTNGGCDYYELIQYYDNDGNVNIVDTSSNSYYYLVTRDTNIVVLRAKLSYTWGTANNKPFTFTSVYNGNDYRNSAYFNINSLSVNIYADTTIENMKIYTTTSATNGEVTPTSSRTSRTIYGRWNNLKIGRGIIKNNNYINFNAIVGGTSGSTGSSANLTKYRLIVESSLAQSMALSAGTSGGTDYLNARGIYGSDYDRVTNNNDNLEVRHCASGSWGGTIRGKNNTDIALDLTVKSGSFGSNHYDYATGIYVGGRNGGTHYSPRAITVEGGYIYNLIGGPLTASSQRAYNDTYMYIKGGSIDLVIGGAGRSETYGNRIVQVTGGTINYSVFGGSNGIEGGNNEGTLTGTPYVYVGGNAIIGNSNYLGTEERESQVEAGSVFGIGNGKNGNNSIGSCDNSNVIIDGKALVRNNVYGGGNYGATGYSSSSNTNITNIKIKGGTINGSVYGGGNNNGAGTSSKISTINIEMTGGNVIGSLYGGSRINGTVYGNTNVNVLGGVVNRDVYGGGEGNNTYVSRDVSVKIGDNAYAFEPNIKNSVYGGSAFGTVNNTTRNTTVTNYKTSVVVNKGIISGSVFGGGMGSSTYTPYVAGNVTVTTNGGNIGSIFGGNDAAGSPNGMDIVYLNGGTIGNAFGGGNNTGQKSSDIYLQGATVTNLFGGSNSSGTVNDSKVTVTSGTVNNIYGGNNSGGLTGNSNVNVKGSNILGDIYGGGSLADTNTSKVNIQEVKVNDVYGGGEQASCDTTDITLNGVVGHYIFGGSNVFGNVDTSKIVVNGVDLGRIYGGNNSGGSTAITNILVYSGSIGDIFGGGDNAISTTSNITVNGGMVNNVYGGGNEAGLTTSNIKLISGNFTNVFGGSNMSGNITTANVEVGNDTSTLNSLVAANVYGGNNMGGLTINPYVTVKNATIGNVYGGGYQAIVNEGKVVIISSLIDNVYGGGNVAGVNKDTYVDINDSIIKVNVYGGGNEGVVLGNTEVFLTNTNVDGSAYAGGNGSTAIVSHNTTITIDGNSVIGTSTTKPPLAGSVFGSGNAAATGDAAASDSTATVNIVGATIYGNVYGGANTSVVYGKTITNIGTNVVSNNDLIESDIIIQGTVFGGGEANASGSDIYDFEFISVTDAINIYIDGSEYIDNGHKFLINGSIFGSGNASSSSGTSDIFIKNLGTRDEPSKNISIQRADTVVLDNSVIELSGTTDRTNDFSTIKYSFNRIDLLKVKNNTVLLLKQNANLLKEFESLVDINGKEVVAKVDIDDETKTVTKNVDNRLYLLSNRNLNITINQAATAYGKVKGMTFFGMYNSYDSGTFQYGVYDDSVSYGDSADAGDMIIGGSYVLGLHSLNHDITVDGFYTNYLSEDYTNVTTAYIEPIPPEAGYYMWTIGIQAINYTVDLNASKYASLGALELSMIDFSAGNTTFDVIGFNSEGLKNGVSLVEPTDVPKIASNPDDANKILGLSIKTETREWTDRGVTTFFTGDGVKYKGDTTFKTDSQQVAPSLMFYLYHAKNITINEEIGTVVISLQAKTPKNEIEDDVQLITITVNITATDFDDNDFYDASITYDKKYEMPSATSVNITNQSQFTAYYSIFARTESFEDFYGINNSNYHTLVTNRALPIGTQITMIDIGDGRNNPKYYYYTIDENRYNMSLDQLNNDGEISYRLSEFIKMGNINNNNTYNDAEANLTYYSANDRRVLEEFIFIFDFKETTVTGTNLGNSMLFELRNSEDRSLISVLGIRQNLMFYNTYDSSNVVLSEEVTTDNNYLYYDLVNEFSLSTNVMYDQTANSEAIINTNYESNSMGLNIEVLDSTLKQVSSSMLTGTNIMIDNIRYFADSDGVFRIKLAGKVSNLSKKIYITTDKMLPSGTYTLRFTLFASPDGRHNSHTLESSSVDILVTVVGSDNSIVVETEDETKLVYGETGLNESGLNYNEYTISFNSVLNNPNARISLYKRSTENKDTMEYIEVPINSLFTNYFVDPSSMLYIASSDYEKMLNINVNNKATLKFNLASDLTSGTYKIVFKLYDNNQLIEEEIKYVIVRKNVE